MFIYKICHQAEWAQAERQGPYSGTPKDREDGFIHFSTAKQLPGTLARYYAEAKDLLLVAVDPAPLGEALRFEPSRDGALFPHLYGSLPLAAVRWTKPIARNKDGGFMLPEECA